MFFGARNSITTIFKHKNNIFNDFYIYNMKNITLLYVYMNNVHYITGDIMYLEGIIINTHFNTDKTYF